MSKPINSCRVCGNKNLEVVLELGVQALTGVFPKHPDTQITAGPLTLIKCAGSQNCGLLQLSHSYPSSEMYGANYGYRSGLNPSMVSHLRSKIERIKGLDLLRTGDVVLDIGSNDGTTLKQYGMDECVLVGVDPTGRKFQEFYTSNIQLIPDFFDSFAFLNKMNGRKAKVITSFAMMYDLEDPIAFVKDVSNALADDGVWVLEQSYMPSMLTATAYDTVCHEHVEYYGLAQIQWIVERAGLSVVDVELSDVNGGSFSVIVQKPTGSLPISHAVSALAMTEQAQRLDLVEPYVQFGERVVKSKKTLVEFLEKQRGAGRKVSALGASTKGNVILQYCGINTSLVSCIGEINADKFGSFTPGTRIPIVDEKQMIAESPEYVLVLPWHFRKFFDTQERYSSLKLVYPLPVLSCREQ